MTMNKLRKFLHRFIRLVNAGIGATGFKFLKEIFDFPKLGEVDLIDF